MVSASFGGIVPIYDGLEVIASLGLKYDSSFWLRFNYFGDNVSWSRYVANIALSYKTKYVRMSAGYICHHKPTLTSKGDTEKTVWVFDDAMGINYQLDYLLNDKSSIGLRYERIEYKREDISLVNGNNVGVILRIFFDHV